MLVFLNVILKPNEYHFYCHCHSLSSLLNIGIGLSGCLGLPGVWVAGLGSSSQIILPGWSCPSPSPEYQSASQPVQLHVGIISQNEEVRQPHCNGCFVQWSGIVYQSAQQLPCTKLSLPQNLPLLSPPPPQAWLSWWHFTLCHDHM